MVSGIFTAILLVGFLGLAAWAYSPHSKRRFSEAAALALVEDVRPRADTTTEASR